MLKSDVSDSKLPDFDDFLRDWSNFLKSEQRVSSVLLREAFRLQGTPAIGAFAKQHADQYPGAYMDWIEALEQEGAKPEAVLDAVREGLDAIPRDYVARAAVAAVLARIGAELGDPSLELEGHRERFHSQPSMEHVLDLYVAAIARDRWEEAREHADRRVKELLTAEKNRQATFTTESVSAPLFPSGLQAMCCCLAGVMSRWLTLEVNIPDITLSEASLQQR